MTKEEVIKLAEKIVLGTATEEEILQYNRICDFAETTERSALNISEEEKNELGRVLKEGIFQKAGFGKVHRINWLKWTAVAASVLLVLGLSWMLLFQNKKEAPVVLKTDGKTNHAVFVVRHEVNTTGKEKRIQLQDGSLIVLTDKSELTYREPFVNKREITLSGKAHFKVAKDPTRPFTVISGDITTTALGTEFTVTAFAKASQISVRLYEGKVVIKPVEKNNWRLKNDFYLSPGQEFVYSEEALAYVRTFNQNNAASDKIRNKEPDRDNPSIPKDDEGSWFMFNNQSLGQVLDNLAGLYNVKIVYQKKDVQDINWTGQYNKSDSLETILKRIGIVHNLTITKTDSAFIISK